MKLSAVALSEHAGGELMNETLLRSWVRLAVRGAIAIGFGIAVILWPGITLVTLTALFAAVALFAGALWIFGAVRYRKAGSSCSLLLVLGALSIASGVMASLHPVLATVALILLVGANALVKGVLDIVAALRGRKIIHGEWLLLMSGTASLLFGAFVLLFPTGAGALALALVVGIYAIITGVMLLALSVQVRSWSRMSAGRSGPSAGASRGRA